VPCLVGAFMVRRQQPQVAVFYSPHGSRSLGTLRRLGSVALYAARSMLRSSPRTAIVNMPEETHAFDDWQAVDLVESPVSEAFFAVRRNEARHPLIVCGGSAQGIRSAELVAQLAVLLSGDDLRISFNWVGPLDAISRTRLNAANVGVFDSRQETEVGARFGAGWIYFAPGGTRGFPISLVEAMATGLPCVAINSTQHRQVLSDGETGFLCDSQREVIARIATLIDSPQLRASIGQAAREAARHRFSVSRFDERLLAAYSLTE
jgi:glycosyltransferase involved in cell wall biosynthesis